MGKIIAFMKRLYYTHMIEVCDDRAVVALGSHNEELYEYWSIQKIDFVMKCISI